MALPTIGASLGQNLFKVQDTFTWEDLRQGHGGSAKQARHSWEINDLPRSEEAHFFELWMDAFEDHGEFSMVLSMYLRPYDYLVSAGTVSFQAVKAEGLVPLVVTYLEGMFGVPAAKRIIRQYGGKMLEWLQSVAVMYEQEVEE